MSLSTSLLGVGRPVRLLGTCWRAFSRSLDLRLARSQGLPPAPAINAERVQPGRSSAGDVGLALILPPGRNDVRAFLYGVYHRTGRLHWAHRRCAISRLFWPVIAADRADVLQARCGGRLLCRFVAHGAVLKSNPVLEAISTKMVATSADSKLANRKATARARNA